LSLNGLFETLIEVLLKSVLFPIRFGGRFCLNLTEILKIDLSAPRLFLYLMDRGLYGVALTQISKRLVCSHFSSLRTHRYLVLLINDQQKPILCYMRSQFLIYVLLSVATVMFRSDLFLSDVRTYGF